MHATFKKNYFLAKNKFFVCYKIVYIRGQIYLLSLNLRSREQILSLIKQITAN